MGLRKIISEAVNMISQKRVPPAAERNKIYIYQVLKKLLPRDQKMDALEIASGSGLHVSYLADKFSNITFQPSDIDEEQWPSLKAYKADHKNIKDPIKVDITKNFQDWECEDLPSTFHLILNINMIHISPWQCSEGLFRNSGALLHSDGILVTYGPYAKNGQLTPESNVEFNRNLQAQNPEWGIRDIGDLADEAREHGLYLCQEFDLPANNKMLVFRKNNCLG